MSRTNAYVRHRIREVSVTIIVTGKTDRDAWDWGDAIARSLKADFVEDGEDYGPVDVACVYVEDEEQVS